MPTLILLPPRTVGVYIGTGPSASDAAQHPQLPLLRRGQPRWKQRDAVEQRVAIGHRPAARSACRAIPRRRRRSGNRLPGDAGIRSD